MKNHFNNSYGSGGYIPCRLTAMLFLAASAGLHFSFKNLSRIYNKMDRVGLLGRRLGGAAGKRCPPNGPKNACAKRAEMLLLIHHAQGSSSMERLKRHKRVFSFSFHFIVYKDTAQNGSFMHPGCPFFPFTLLFICVFFWDWRGGLDTDFLY
jgi:hypothetical protein